MPAQRADGVAGMVGIAKRERLTAAGTFAVSEQMEALLNSRGVDLYHSQTLAEASVTMLAENSSGWQKSNSPDIDEIDALGLAETAAEKAKRSANPKELAAGKYTVILEPAAVLDLVGLHVLGFWRHGAARPAFVLEQPHRAKDFRREHYDRRRCLSSFAIGSRLLTAKACAARGWSW